MKKMRQVFADTMLEVGSVDPSLVVMVGDISHGILTPFASAHPDRYYNVGICEPTIVGMASGISKVGLTPVVHTIAPFIIERSYEQIKLDFGYQQLKGNFISVGSAFDYSQLGCSHHCYTDISLMSHFANGQVFFPSSPIEFELLFREAYSEERKINYFRLPERTHGVTFSADDVAVGKGIQVTEGTSLTCVVIGPLLKNALEAYSTLSLKGISMEILYFPTIKPLDHTLLLKSLKKTSNVLVIEEASSRDGIFNAVLQASHHLGNIRYDSIAITDFVYGYGSYETLLEKCNMHPEGIVHHAEKLVSNQSALASV